MLPNLIACSLYKHPTETKNYITYMQPYMRSTNSDLVDYNSGVSLITDTTTDYDSYKALPFVSESNDGIVVWNKLKMFQFPRMCIEQVVSFEKNASDSTIQYPIGLLYATRIKIILISAVRAKIEFNDFTTKDDYTYEFDLDTPIDPSKPIHIVFNYSKVGMQLYLNYNKVADRTFTTPLPINEVLHFGVVRAIKSNKNTMRIYYTSIWNDWLDSEEVTKTKEMERYNEYKVFCNKETIFDSKYTLPFFVRKQKQRITKVVYPLPTMNIVGKVTALKLPIKHNAIVYYNDNNSYRTTRTVYTDKEGNFTFRNIPYSKDYVLTAVDNSDRYNAVAVTRTM